MITKKQLIARITFASIILTPFAFIVGIDGWPSLFAFLKFIGVIAALLAMIVVVLATLQWSIKNL